MKIELDDLPVVDRSLAMKLTGNQPQVADELLSMLVKTLPADLETINSLFTSKNYPDLLARVHKLHGATCYCGTTRLKIILQCIECDLKNNELEKLAIYLDQLNAEVELLMEECK